MPQVSVTINDRQYRMACEDGQEEHLSELAASFDQQIAAVRKSFGEIGDLRLTVIAALMVADQLFESQQRTRQLEAEVAAFKDRRTAAADHAQATQSAVIAALNAAAERIEQVTKGLNQTLTEPVPLG
jgi:cell division protein ZapA